MKLASALEDQFKFDVWAKDINSKKIFNRIKKKITSRTSNRLYRRYNIIRSMSRIEMLEHPMWSKQEKLHNLAGVGEFYTSKLIQQLSIG